MLREKKRSHKYKERIFWLFLEYSLLLLMQFTIRLDEFSRYSLKIQENSINFMRNYLIFVLEIYRKFLKIKKI